MTDFDMNYAYKDMADVLADMKTRIASATGGKWNDFLDSDVGYTLLKSFAALNDMNLFYTDKQLAETFLSTCSLRESAVRIAKSLNYPIGRISAATVQARLTFPALNEQIEIDENSVWKINNIDFICQSQIIIPSGQTSIDISLIQGTEYARTIIADGTAWKEITIPQKCCQILVTVDDEEWSAIDSFIDVADEKSYKLAESANGYVITFGADLNTKKPIDGQVIRISAILTEGDKGNIGPIGYPVIPITQIKDSGNNELNNYFSGVTLTSALGGRDAESIQSIKTNAPLFYGTQGRVVTAKDYEAVVNNLAGVVESKVIGGEEVGRYGQVIIVVRGSDPYDVSTDFKNMVKEALEKVKVITIELDVQAPEVIDIDIVLNVGVIRDFTTDLSQARTGIVEALSNCFDALKIGDSLYESNVLSVLQNLDFVKYANYTTSCSTGAVSEAGQIAIPVIGNIDATNVVLRKANSDVLFSGDASSKIQQGYFKTVSTGLTDQLCTLHFNASSDDVLISYLQLVRLVSLDIRAEFA